MWSVKDWIDRKWMRMYSGPSLAAMRMPAAVKGTGELVAAAAGPSAVATLQAATMRCCGCASKVGIVFKLQYYFA